MYDISSEESTSGCLLSANFFLRESDNKELSYMAIGTNVVFKYSNGCGTTNGSNARGSGNTGCEIRITQYCWSAA